MTFFNKPLYIRISMSFLRIRQSLLSYAFSLCIKTRRLSILLWRGTLSQVLSLYLNQDGGNLPIQKCMEVEDHPEPCFAFCPLFSLLSSFFGFLSSQGMFVMFERVLVVTHLISLLAHSRSMNPFTLMASFSRVSISTTWQILCSFPDALFVRSRPVKKDQTTSPSPQGKVQRVIPPFTLHVSTVELLYIVQS